MKWLLLCAAPLLAQNADSDLNRGIALFRSGNVDQAQSELAAAAQRYPADPRFPLELAGLAYRTKNMGAAKSYLRASLRLDPRNEYGNEFLAMLYFAENNLPAALRYWNRVNKPFIQELRFDPEPRLPTLLKERAFAISGGQVFTGDRLDTTEANLDRLGIFASTKFDLTLRPDQRFDLTFRSAESGQSAGGWLGRVLPFARGLPYQALHFDRYNIGQQALNFTSLGRWDPNKRRAFLSLSGPLQLNPRLKFRTAIDARDETWDLSTTYYGQNNTLEALVLRKVEAGGELEYGLNGRLAWTSGLWVTRRGFQNEGQEQTFASSWSFLLDNSLSYQLLAVPERRFRVDAKGRVKAGRVLTAAPSRLLKLETSLNGIWLPQAKGDDVQVDFRAAGGTIIGRAPFDELYILGMERDNDLWLRGHAGTRDGRKGSAPLGKDFTLFQSSVTRTVFKLPFVRFQAGPFFDLGRAGDPSGNFGSRGWMTDAGIQLKVRVLGGLTWTAVYGRNLRDRGGVFYTAVSR